MEGEGKRTRRGYKTLKFGAADMFQEGLSDLWNKEPTTLGNNNVSVRKTYHEHILLILYLLLDNLTPNSAPFHRLSSTYPFGLHPCITGH